MDHAPRFDIVQVPDGTGSVQSRGLIKPPDVALNVCERGLNKANVAYLNLTHLTLIIEKKHRVLVTSSNTSHRADNALFC